MNNFSFSIVMIRILQPQEKKLYFQDKPEETKLIKDNIIWSGNEKGRLWHLNTFSRINSVDPYSTRNENLREIIETSNHIDTLGVRNINKLLKKLRIYI